MLQTIGASPVPTQTPVRFGSACREVLSGPGARHTYVRSIERVYGFAERDRQQPGTSQEETDMASMSVTTAARPVRYVTHSEAAAAAEPCLRGCA